MSEPYTALGIWELTVALAFEYLKKTAAFGKSLFLAWDTTTKAGIDMYLNSTVVSDERKYLFVAPLERSFQTLAPLDQATTRHKCVYLTAWFDKLRDRGHNFLDQQEHERSLQELLPGHLPGSRIAKAKFSVLPAAKHDPNSSRPTRK
jgi:hypothetical protein